MKCEVCGKEADRITRREGEEKFICAKCREKLAANERARQARAVA